MISNLIFIIFDTNICTFVCYSFLSLTLSHIGYITMNREKMYNKKFGILMVDDACGNNESKTENRAKIEQAVADYEGQVCCMAIVPKNETVIMKNLIYWCDSCNVDVIIISEEIDFSEDTNVIHGAMSSVKRGVSGIYNMQGCLYKNKKKILTPIVNNSSSVFCVTRNQTQIIYLRFSVDASAIVTLVTLDVAFSLLDNNRIPSKDHNTIQGEKKLNNLTAKPNLEEILRDAENHPSKYQYPNCPTYEAKAIISNRIALKRAEMEEVTWENSYKRILAITIQSDYDVPSFRTSKVHGYAVLSVSHSGEMTILGQIQAGQNACPKNLYFGQCVRVDTGAPVPKGAKAVIKTEYAELCDPQLKIRILQDRIPAGVSTNIKEIGSTIKKGTIILNKGTYIKEHELGTLAKCGVKKITVFKKIVVGILSIGNELQEPGEDLNPYSIYDSNRVVLLKSLEEDGYDCLDFGVIRKDAKAIVNHIDESLNLIDVLILMDSASMASETMLNPILTGVYGADIHFSCDYPEGERSTFATCTYKEMKKYFLCLPGSPGSTMTTANYFAFPLLSGLAHKGQ